MLKKIPTSRIRAGMFVESVEGPWLSHTLWKQRFLIKDQETLERVRGCGAAECWIDVSKGDDVTDAAATPAVAPAIAPAAAPAPKPVQRTSMADELHNATNVLKHSRATVNSLFAEARMGN